MQFNGVKAKGQLLNCTGAMIVLVAANSTSKLSSGLQSLCMFLADVLRQSIFFSSQEDAEGQYDLQQQSTLMSTQGDHVSAFLALRGWLNGELVNICWYPGIVADHTAREKDHRNDSPIANTLKARATEPTRPADHGLLLPSPTRMRQSTAFGNQHCPTPLISSRHSRAR